MTAAPDVPAPLLRAQMLKARGALLALAWAIPLVAGARPGRAQEPIPQTEQSDVLTLPPANPHRVLVTDGVYNHAKDGRVYVVDADHARMLGMIPAAFYANFAIDPAGKNFYVGETIWTRGNRGTRQDLLSIYDARTLNLAKEIDLPGRALVTTKKQDMDISADGAWVYVYNMAPSNSVILVDTRAQKVAGTVATPGCGLVFAWGAHGYSSVCADGSLVNVDIADPAHPAITRTPGFFDPDQDPVFEQSPSDRATGRTYFISYTGMVTPITLGPAARPEAAWSIEAAAGQDPAPGADRAFVTAWRPGGWQIADLHRADGHLYVLMHEGKFWSHKDDGTEVWELDVATHKLLNRFHLPVASNLVGVTQDDRPLMFAASDDGGFLIMDATTGALLRWVKKLGDTLIFTQAVGE